MKASKLKEEKRKKDRMKTLWVERDTNNKKRKMSIWLSKLVRKSNSLKDKGKKM